MKHMPLALELHYGTLNVDCIRAQSIWLWNSQNP